MVFARQASNMHYVYYCHFANPIYFYTKNTLIKKVFKNKLILEFSKDALKGTVKSFIMLQNISVSKICKIYLFLIFAFYLSKNPE